MKMTAKKLVETVENETKKAFPNIAVIKQSVLNAAYIIEEHEQVIKLLTDQVAALQIKVAMKS